METAEKIIDTPLGKTRIVATERGICRMDFTEKIPSSRPSESGSPKAAANLARAERQLREYFDGKRTEFDLPLDLQGTEMQQRVWKRLQEIPFGKTLSYGDLARRVGSPKAARAVGSACGKNPVSLVVPCHRVIGTDGGLHGYGGGLWRKKALLEHENPNRKLPL